MAGWHHQLSGHEFEETKGDSEGQRSLACCSPWGGEKSDTTEQQNKRNFTGGPLDFTGGPLFKNQLFHCRKRGFNSWAGN